MLQTPLTPRPAQVQNLTASSEAAASREASLREDAEAAAAAEAAVYHELQLAEVRSTSGTSSASSSACPVNPIGC